MVVRVEIVFDAVVVIVVVILVPDAVVVVVIVHIVAPAVIVVVDVLIVSLAIVVEIIVIATAWRRWWLRTRRRGRSLQPRVEVDILLEINDLVAHAGRIP